jgi:hypothetical protein
LPDHAPSFGSSLSIPQQARELFSFPSSSINVGNEFGVVAEISIRRPERNARFVSHQVHVNYHEEREAIDEDEQGQQDHEEQQDLRTSWNISSENNL